MDYRRINKLVLIFALTIATTCAFAETHVYRIGHAQINTKLNILEENSVPARLLQSALVAPLVYRKDDGRMAFVLADSFQRSPDGVRSSFRLRPGVKFSNEELILGTDVLTSFDRCKKKGELDEVRSYETRLQTYADRTDLWLDVFMKNNQADAAKALGRCPIIHSETARVFGDRLGEGTQVVGGGSYRFNEWIAGQRYSLTPRTPSPNGATILDFIRIESIEMALSSLRRGDIDAFFTSNSEVIARAHEDETLAVDLCNGEQIIKRKRFAMTCQTNFVISEIGYGV